MEKNRIKKIAVVGAESTGKTWLCEALSRHYQTIFVPEYAREYFNNSDLYNYTMEDLVVIAKKQIELERAAIKKAKRFLFCDTTLITLKIWAELEFKNSPAFIEDQLPKIKYDYYFLTDNQIPWQQDAQRQNKHSRDLIFQMNETAIKKLSASYAVIRGTEETRLKNAVMFIDKIG